MSRGSKTHEFCIDFSPYFAGWCGLATLLVTIYFGVGGQKSLGGTIAFIVGTSCLTIIIMIVSVYLVNEKRKQVQKDRAIELLDRANRRREQITANKHIEEIAVTANATKSAIESLKSSGFKLDTAQFSAVTSIATKLGTIIERCEKRDAIRDAEKDELCATISKLGKKVNYLTFEVKTSNQSKAQPETVSIISECSKSLSSLQ